MANILILEDETLMHFALRSFLTAHRVEFAEDFWQAQELYDAAKKQGKPFDLVITDLNNPGETSDCGGHDLMTHVRRQEADFPIILMSGMPRDAQKVLSSEPVLFANIPFLSKPYHKVDFMKVVTSMLPGEPQGRKIDSKYPKNET